MKVKRIGRFSCFILSVLLCCSFIFIPGFAENTDAGAGGSVRFAEPGGSEAGLSSVDEDPVSLRHTRALYKAAEATAYRGEEVTREVERIRAEAGLEDNVEELILDYLQSVYPSHDRFIAYGKDVYDNYRGGDLYEVVIAAGQAKEGMQYTAALFGDELFESASDIGIEPPSKYTRVILKSNWNVGFKTAIEALENNPMVLLIDRLSRGSSTEPAVLGDVDGDGEITAADARLALRCSIELEKYERGSREFRSADVGSDGEVTASDARAILRVAIELDTETALRGADWAQEEATLLSMSFDELAREVDSWGDDTVNGVLILEAQAIAAKIHDVPVERLNDIITSEKSTYNLKNIVLEACDNEKDPVLLDYDALEKEMKDPGNPNTYRCAILCYLDHYYTYAEKTELIETLEALTGDGDDLVRSYALSAFYCHSPERATEVIDGIIYSDGPEAGYNTMWRALGCKAEHIAGSGDKRELDEFIAYCEKCFAEDRYVGTLTSALIDTRSIEGVRMVMDGEYADEEMKMYCVYQDYPCIEEWFATGDLTAEKLGFFLKCLDVFPANPGAEALKTAVDSHPAFFEENPELLQRVNGTIERIGAEGEDIWSSR